MIIGYARVSTTDQNPQTQIEAIRASGAKEIFLDRQGGKSLERPEFIKMRKRLLPGDTLVFYKLDRIGRSLLDVLNFLQNLSKDDVMFRSISEPMIDSSKNDPLSKAMQGMLAVFAELERNIIRERVREGVAIAKAQGKFKGRGRPKRLGVLDVNSLKSEMKSGERTVPDLCKKYKVSKRTYYRLKSSF